MFAAVLQGLKWPHQEERFGLTHSFHGLAEDTCILFCIKGVVWPDGAVGLKWLVCQGHPRELRRHRFLDCRRGLGWNRGVIIKMISV